MNQLQCMRVFVEVVEKNSFGHAAHALRMATASVSVQVKNLESHLGTRLLYRTTRSITLTEEGARYYRHCKRVIEEMENMEASLSGAKSAPRGRLRVDADESYVCNLLVPVLPEFFDRYPDIHIDFVHTGHFFDINDTGADVMLRMFTSPPEDPSVIARPIGTTQLVCAASPEYLEEHGTPRTPQDLSMHRCLLFMDTLTGRRWEWVFERGGERIVCDFPDAVAFCQRLARVAAAVRGIGILRDLQCDITQQLRSGQLRQVLEDWVSPAPRSYVVYGQSRQETGKVQAFADFVLEKYPATSAISGL